MPDDDNTMGSSATGGSNQLVADDPPPVEANCPLFQQATEREEVRHVEALIGMTLQGIRPVDAVVREQAERRQGQLRKSPGSLGRLESLGVALAMSYGEFPPPYPDRVEVAVFAGDHGIQVHGASPWPTEVTGQLVESIVNGGAAVSVLAREVGARVSVYDMGMLSPRPEGDGFYDHRVAAGTADMTAGPAMTQVQCMRAIRAGLNIGAQAHAGGARLVVPAEVGIANTTAAAALIAVFTGVDPEFVTGIEAGAGVERFALKKRLVTQAISINGLTASGVATDPLVALAAVGGFEHAAMVGFMLGAASCGVPVLLDGVNACASALVAAAVAPDLVGWLIAGHAGAEPGVRAALDRLGLVPVLDLDRRLGQGSGALAEVPTLRAAAAIMRDMTKLESAGVAREP